ncbi:MAG: four helix bundle protein [bacterium]|nr:four helix bundle protein [bacterium]
MQQTSVHQNAYSNNLPILSKLAGAYKVWHSFFSTLPRSSRYTLAAKIDILFADTIELLLIASYSQRNDKIFLLEKATQKLDSLKFFLQIAWEIKALDNNKYLAVSAPLNEVGKMLGGWRKQVERALQPAQGKQNSLHPKWREK